MTTVRSNPNAEMTRADLLALLEDTQDKLTECEQDLVATKEYAETLASELATAREELSAAEQEREILVAEIAANDDTSE